MGNELTFDLVRQVVNSMASDPANTNDFMNGEVSAAYWFAGACARGAIEGGAPLEAIIAALAELAPAQDAPAQRLRVETHRLLTGERDASNPSELHGALGLAVALEPAAQAEVLKAAAWWSADRDAESWSWDGSLAVIHIERAARAIVREVALGEASQAITTPRPAEVAQVMEAARLIQAAMRAAVPKRDREQAA